MATPRARWSRADAAPWIREARATDHKYRRGVLGVRTGSGDYPGAAVLGVEAAWRAGVGMVRYLAPTLRADHHGTAPSDLVLANRPETVVIDGSVDAWLVGSGIDPRTQFDDDRRAVAEILSGDTPVVIDAGALELVAEHPHCPAPVIITPHLGEFRALWHRVLGEAVGEPQRLAEELGVTILLKGSVTTVASPAGETIEVGPASPWLATAGTGDVLAGVLGALLASHPGEAREHSSLLRLGATAALIHDRAARSLTPPFTAFDLATAIAPIVCELGGLSHDPTGSTR